MNPNTCTVCELMFTRVMKARKITVDVSVLFADLRGYTRETESQSHEVMSSVLDDFYDDCAAAIWEFDGLLNKTIGDAVMAIFNFPIARPDHAECAVLAAREIQSRFEARRTRHSIGSASEKVELGVGIGIDSGNASFGEFGRAHRDLTAIGTVVNTASRAQSVAAGGEVLVTKAVHDRASRQISPATPGKEFRLKGLENPVELFAV